MSAASSWRAQGEATGARQAASIRANPPSSCEPITMPRRCMSVASTLPFFT